jgi:hypothetical protein
MSCSCPGGIATPLCNTPAPTLGETITDDANSRASLFSALLVTIAAALLVLN